MLYRRCDYIKNFMFINSFNLSRAGQVITRSNSPVFQQKPYVLAAVMADAIAIDVDFTNA